MQENVKSDSHGLRIQVIEQFLNAFGNHFTRCEIKLNGEQIIIKVEQLCSQDLNFLSWVNYLCSDMLATSIARSGKGLKIFIGIVKPIELSMLFKELQDFKGQEFKDDNPYWLNFENKQTNLNLEQSALPLINYLKKNYHPHAKAIVNDLSVEIVEGVEVFNQ